jgi:DNA invertase Pin-like site-specific DNA recombinase
MPAKAFRQITVETPQTAAPLRVAAYCRVSTDSEDQLHSYAAQIKEYTERIGQQPGWVLADIYCDEGLSGTKLNKRDDMLRLIADCKRGKINRVLVKSVSRFCRNTHDSLTVARLLKHLGVSIYFEEQDMDTALMSDEFMLTMQSEAAQNESINLSKNMRWSYERRMEKGEFFGTVPAYGYKLAGKTMEIHEPEAQTVRRVFAMYLSGMGKQAIANLLNNEGVPRRFHQEKWYANAVDYILSSERYVGDALLQKKLTTEFPFKKVRNKGQAPQWYIENSHPPIISREDFEAVQRLQQQRRQTYPGSTGWMPHPLTGKLVCPDCGRAFRRLVTNGTAYWQCAAGVSGSKDCQPRRYSEDAVYAAFTLILHKLAASRAYILVPLISQLTELQERHNGIHGRVCEIDRQIAELNGQSITIASHHAKGYLDAAEFAARTGAVTAKVSALRAERRKLLTENENDAMLDELDGLNNLLAITDPQTGFDAELFEQMVERVTAVSLTELRFTLKGGLTLTETVTRTDRRKTA